MRSFIKAHKKSTSFDESPKRHSNFSGNTNNSSQRSSDDSLDFLPSTPSQMNYDSIPPPAKHSPGFESFHRLANKTSKLFKKTSNSNLNSHLASTPTTSTNQTTSNSFVLQNPPTKNTGPPPPLPPPLFPSSSTSSFSRHDNESEYTAYKKTSPAKDFNRTTDSLPAIKGTITHSWGDSKVESHVIILNDPASPASNTSEATSSKQFKTPMIGNENLTSTTSPSNLEPAIRILNKNKGKQQENIDDAEDGSSKKEHHVYKALALAKNRNRQARIHSHDDIINLGKASQMDMSLLAAAFSGNSTTTINNDQSSNEQTDEKILDIERVTTTSTLTSSETTSPINKSPCFYSQTLSLSPKIRHGDLQSSPSKVNKNDSQNETLNKKKVRISLNRKEEKKVYSLNNNSDEYSVNEKETHKANNCNDESSENGDGDNDHDDDYDDDDDDDDDDDESEFSFEYAGINVRTSSVKYYSKPEPAANVYIDDLYEDENFDDDMNCIEDDESGNEGNEICGLSTRFEETSLKSNKVKKFNDLFNLSDDDEEEDGKDNSNNGDENESDNLYQKQLENGKETFNGNHGGHHDDASLGETVDNKEQFLINDNVKKPIQKYNDLFDLSDEDDNDDKEMSEAESYMFSDEAPSIESGPANAKPTRGIYSQSNKNIIRDGKPNYSFSLKRNNSDNETEHTSAMKASLTGTTGSTKPTVKSFSDIFNVDDSASDAESDSGTGGNNSNGLVSNDSERQVSLQSSLYETKSESYPPNHPHSQILQTPAKIVITPSVSDAQSQALAITDDDGEDDDDDTSSILRTPFQLIDSSHSQQPHYASPQYTAVLNSPPLPPPARSQSLKYHDLNCDLDSEVPRPMSNLFFIDEAEEDEYNQKSKFFDFDHYDIDEINGIPEDFNFSDSERDDLNRRTLKSPLRGGSKNREVSPFSSVSSSFRSTHSFNGKLTINQGAKELAPMKNKIELTNKTVTFFNSNNWNTYDCNSLSRKTSSQMRDSKYQNHNVGQSVEPSSVRSPQHQISNGLDGKCNDNYVISPNLPTTITPTNSFTKPTPEFSNDYSLSPIQETPSSVQSSPKRA
ncbi:ABH_G0014670.mRNA.1.CDS.1 [Saccharomyces cerevisiae]|nr:Zrg8p [Saccharomyces cerevisiae YJM1338]AJV36120.1 Zrg8p [Saccharomyces cerevisiae YJM456]CAI4520802.1 ABH_G0014670.mRNA.1.CDS.1 [Saccharomyces cerevisiae]CAI6709726.1 ABH_G0014670.mRNA.1.CDS.1 [Saccharomyces cerevisiae]